MLRVTWDDRSLQGAVRDFVRKAGDLRPAFREMGEILHGSVMRNFAAGGRPQRWRPNTPATIERKARKSRGRRRRRAIAGNKPLLDTGRLRASITYRATRDFAEVGTNVVYGPTHQFGRGIIPARPFLAIQKEDEARMTRALERYLDEALS